MLAGDGVRRAQLRRQRHCGGNGAREVEYFYERHFIFNMPPDMELVPVSRIVGAEHIVEESVFRFTHTVELDWMLPGLAPTGRRVEIAVVSVVKMEGDKLAHEHIYWDQGSVLAQLGLLDADALPVAGADAARKILDRTVPVNQLMKRLWQAPRSGARSEPKASEVEKVASGFAETRSLESWVVS